MEVLRESNIEDECFLTAMTLPQKTVVSIVEQPHFDSNSDVCYDDGDIFTRKFPFYNQSNPRCA